MKKILVSLLIFIFMVLSIFPAFAAEDVFTLEFLKWEGSTGDGYVLADYNGKKVNLSENKDTADIPKGTTVEITIKAESGCEISSVSYNGAPMSYERPATELNMKIENYSGNNSIKVTFDKAAYMCSTSCIGNGKIIITSPDTEETFVKVPVGESFAFTVVADDNNEIYSMTVNGKEVDLSKYGKNETNKISKFAMEIPDVREDTEVVVTFKGFNENPPITVKHGDVNKDGKVNVVDATAIQKNVAGIVTFDNLQKLSADVDADTKITVKDATTIQKHSAGIISSFPADRM